MTSFAQQRDLRVVRRQHPNLVYVAVSYQWGTPVVFVAVSYERGTQLTTNRPTPKSSRRSGVRVHGVCVRGSGFGCMV